MTIALTVGAGQKIHADLDKIPDSCPICHRGVNPNQPGGNHIGPDGSLEIVFCCPIHACNHLFLGRYKLHVMSGRFFLDQCLPQELQEPWHQREIQEISPDFCSIYNEAYKTCHSEGLGLSLE